MNFNKKKAVALLMAFILVWGGNLFWYNHKLLKSPLFVKCYYDLQEATNFRLYYIQNINDNYGIAGITFPELDNEYVNYDEGEQGSTKYYKMKVIGIDFRTIEEVQRRTKGKEVKLTKANIQFNNGKSTTVNIGEIYLTPNYNEKTLLKYKSAYTDNDNEGGTIYTASGNGVIKGINNRFSTNLNDIVEIKVNDKIISPSEFPIKFKTGDTINVKYNFSFKNHSDIRSNYFYQLSSILDCEDSQEKKSIEYVDVHHYPYIYGIDVKKFEKEGE